MTMIAISINQKRHVRNFWTSFVVFIGPIDFLGTSPQTPWVRFAELWVMYDLPRNPMLVYSLKPRRASPFGSFREKNNAAIEFKKKIFIPSTSYWLKPRRASPFGSFREKNNAAIGCKKCFRECSYRVPRLSRIDSGGPCFSG
jgi:hypothetical protein